MNFNLIQKKIISGKFKFTVHAIEQCDERGLDIENVITALIKGEIIEDYPGDTRGHSCLVLGHYENKPLHIVCGIHEEELIIVTVYVPKLPKWIDEKTRRGSDC